MEVGWDSRLIVHAAAKGGIPEYNALHDRHCTYTRSKAFRASPYARLAQRVRHLGGGTAGAGALAGAGLADRSVLREFLEEASRQEDLQAKGEWGSQKDHPLSTSASTLPSVAASLRGNGGGALTRPVPGAAPSGAGPRRHAGPLFEMQVFKCILVREALLSKARNLARRLRRDPTDLIALHGPGASRRARYRALHDQCGVHKNTRIDAAREVIEEGLAALLDRLRVCTGPFFFCV